jgi:hypothetical protein
MKYLLIVCLAFLCAAAQSQVIGVHTASLHKPQNVQKNDNYGLYMRSQSGIEVGAYRNSYGRDSAYVSQQFDLAKGTWGSLNAQVGLVYGYQKKCNKWDEVSTEVTHKANNYGDSWQEKVTKTIHHEECSGFSRGAIAPLAGFNYTAPISILKATPRIQFVPHIGKHSAVLHLTLETPL